jgi:hypothetical protein
MAFQGMQKRNRPKGWKPAAAGSNSKTFGGCDRINLVRKGLGKAGLKKSDRNRSGFHQVATFGMQNC